MCHGFILLCQRRGHILKTWSVDSGSKSQCHIGGHARQYVPETTLRVCEWSWCYHLDYRDPTKLCSKCEEEENLGNQTLHPALWDPPESHYHADDGGV
jgi:hypothetical protein